jgi:hypothetical protein
VRAFARATAVLDLARFIAWGLVAEQPFVPAVDVARRRACFAWSRLPAELRAKLHEPVDDRPGAAAMPDADWHRKERHARGMWT